jgi:plastocyanin
MLRFGAVLAALTALSFAACGESRKEAGGTTGTTEKETQATGPAVATVKVGETEYKLDPSDPKIAKSGVVAFKATNDGKIAHALEVEGPDGEVKTEPFAPGESQTIKVDLPPGRYEWYCPVDGHKDKGMKGEITVAGGGGAPSTKTTEGGGSSGGGY